MKTIRFITCSLLLLLPYFVFSQTKWEPVSSEISFKIKNAGIPVNGKFSGARMELLFSADKLSASKLKGTVEVATIKTGIGKRDDDLKEEKYFNADKFKLIEVSSTKLYAKGSNYAGMFNVTIKGVTKQVEIPFEFNQLGNEAEFKGSFSINRRDFGVGGETLTMSDDLVVNIDVKAKKG